MTFVYTEADGYTRANVYTMACVHIKACVNVHSNFLCHVLSPKFIRSIALDHTLHFKVFIATQKSNMI